MGFIGGLASILGLIVRAIHNYIAHIIQPLQTWAVLLILEILHDASIR